MPQDNLKNQFAKSEFEVTSHARSDDGELLELSGPSCRGHRTIVHVSPERGTTVGVQVLFSSSSELRGFGRQSPEALQLLGQLTQQLDGQGLSASLLAQEQSIEGVLVKCHICGTASPDQVMVALERTHTVVNRLRSVLEEPTSDIFLTLPDTVRPQLGTLQAELGDEEPAVVPTFDAEQRLRLVKVSEQLKATYSQG